MPWVPEAVAAVLTGVALAASAGFRVFLPLLAVGVAGRWAGFPVAPALSWVTTDAALVMFAAAAIAEFAADKVPAVDHALDAAQTFLSPVAGALVLLGPALALTPAYGIALAIVAGAPVAGLVHATTATARVKSSLGTGGAANPVLSVVEDVLALLTIVVGFLLPLLALLAVAWLIMRRWRTTSTPAHP